MGIFDKAKDALSAAAEKMRDPDKNLVENLWPLGGPDKDHVPDDSAGHTSHDVAPAGLNPVQNADPELDDSANDQYRADEH